MSRPTISNAEWEVMEVLWERHPLGSREVAEALAERRDWSPKTVRTLLSRLVQKGFLSFEPAGGRYLYSPAAPRESCLKTEAHSFLDRVFAGDAHSLLLHFAEEADLSADDLEELKKMLERSEDSA